LAYLCFPVTIKWGDLQVVQEKVEKKDVGTWIILRKVHE